MASATLVSATNEFLMAQWPYIVAIPVAFAASWLLRFLSGKYHFSRIPISTLNAGGEEKQRLAYMKNAKKIYQNGYKNFKNGVFRVSGTNRE